MEVINLGQGMIYGQQMMNSRHVNSISRLQGNMTILSDFCYQLVTFTQL